MSIIFQSCLSYETNNSEAEIEQESDHPSSDDIGAEHEEGQDAIQVAVPRDAV